MIVMHKKRDYLNALLSLFKKSVNDSTIITRKGIGTALLGDRVSSAVIRSGGLSKEYDDALISIVKNKKTVDYLLEQMENSSELRWENVEEKGYICLAPFDEIRSLEEKLNTEKNGASGIRMGEYLTAEQIVLEIKAQNKENAIKEVASLLKKSPEIVNFDTFIKDIFKREELRSTGIGNGIALPHARTDAVENFLIAFGRSEKGIEFDSIDGKPVHLIFVMGTPENRGLNHYLKILARFDRFLRKESFRKALLTATSPDKILEEIRTIEINK